MHFLKLISNGNTKNCDEILKMIKDEPQLLLSKFKNNTTIFHHIAKSDLNLCEVSTEISLNFLNFLRKMLISNYPDKITIENWLDNRDSWTPIDLALIKNKSKIFF